MRLVKIDNRYVNPETVSGVVPAGASAEVRLASGERFTVFGMSVEDVLSAFKRGPTPCTSCRWFIARGPKHPAWMAGTCTARQDGEVGIGCVIHENTAKIGCPQHEEA